MTCIIVDDDSASLEILSRFVKQVNFLNLVGTYSDSLAASHILHTEQIDILFLDVEMPKMTGIELIRSLQRMPQVILITNHDRYAVEAFDYDIADYIIKPATLPRFLKAVNRAQKNLKELQLPDNNKNNFFVKVDSVLVKIRYGDILWVEALGDYMSITTVSKTYTVHSTLTDIENKLPANEFVRVHRSFIVRLDRITSIHDFILSIDQKNIPIGKSYKEKFMPLINLM